MSLSKSHSKGSLTKGKTFSYYDIMWGDAEGMLNEAETDEEQSTTRVC